VLPATAFTANAVYLFTIVLAAAITPTPSLPGAEAFTSDCTLLNKEIKTSRFINTCITGLDDNLERRSIKLNLSNLIAHILAYMN
jgi:hypothetical protein